MPLDQQTFDLKLRAPIATRMREIFGKDGEGWCQFGFTKGAARCLAGAYAEAAGINLEESAVIISTLGVALRRMTNTPYKIASWNDAPERTFADILRVVDEIERIELAGEVR